MPFYWRYSEYTSTSYVNKPDFCAPAVNITVPAYSMNTGASGTSFSTPIVSGTVALLMHKNSTLIGKQSLVKALLSAGAKYRGDTATYIDPVTNTNVFFSDKEGTGIIDAYNSYTVLNQSRYITKSITQSSTSPYTKTFTVSSGDAVIRVSLSWLKRNAMSNFDLYVYKGSTLVAKNAASCVNTNMNMGSYQSLRTVSFDPSDYGYGTYTIKIVYQNVVNSSDSFSVAWY